MAVEAIVERAMEQGQGIVRLAPNWVPRSFCVPGRRIKLHPEDYYSYGGNRGGIDERWFASTTPADNGPLTSPNEGLSFLVIEDGGRTERALLRDAVAQLKDQLIGTRIWEKYGAWPAYSKFFDHPHPLGHHVHHRDEHAKLVGQLGKPEAYYFPPQLNMTVGEFPYTFFGLEPGTTRQQVRQCLENFTKGDNRITALSKAYRLVPGTGWDVPAGILHAPGSLCTYEPQRASDVFAIYQSVVMDRMVVGSELLWKNCPPEKVGDLDYLIEVIDWEANVDPRFAEHHFMEPRLVAPEAQMREGGYVEKWICYRNTAYSAKELTVLPGRTAVIRDAAAYGLICVQGHGSLGSWPIESPALVRFGQLTSDEYFVSESAARAGVKVSNPSRTDPLVILKHFGPENPDLKG
jgi:hypothetical protein